MRLAGNLLYYICGIMTSDNKTFMLILNILFMAPRMVLHISEDERKENGSDSESDSGDSYLATALARLGE